MNSEHYIHLSVDSKGRVSLSKLFPKERVSSVRAYSKDNKIILEPMIEIPASEVWLYKNQESIKKVKKGVEQKASISRGSFAKYAKKD